MASTREETKGRVWIQIDGWQMKGWKGKLQRLVSGKWLACWWRQKPGSEVKRGRPCCGVSFFFLGFISDFLWTFLTCQTSRRCHIWTLPSTLNCHMQLFLKLAFLLTFAAAGQFGLHQNLIKFYCVVKCFGTAPWIIIPGPYTVAQFRVVIKKSLNVIKPVRQQGMK